MTCDHPIPITSPTMPPTVRYVLCQREAGHGGWHQHEEPGGIWRYEPRFRHVEPDATVREQ